jgi:O-antigen ligase
MDAAHIPPEAPSSSTREGRGTRWSRGLSSATLATLVIVVTAALVIGVLRQSMLVFVAAGCVAAVLAATRPRAALLFLFAIPVLFREETWQLQYWPPEFGGTSAHVTTVYTLSFMGLSVVSLLVGVLVLRSVFPDAVDRRLTIGPFETWLGLFAVMAVVAELVGRLATSYSGPIFGQWSQIFLPVIVAFMLQMWCGRRELSRGVDLLAGFVAVRLGFGLSRYLLGGGDYNSGAARRSVFWDSADGFVGVFAVTVGCVWAADRSASRWRRVAGGGMLIAGLIVVVLSYRRQAMVAVAVAAPLALMLLRRWKLLFSAAGFLVAAFVIIVVANPALLTQSTVGKRAVSVVSTRAGMADTNEWHMADIVDAWRNIQENPILGYGFHAAPARRTYELSNRDASLEIVGAYHNLVLNVWFRMGIVGLISLCGLLWCGLRAGARAAWQRGDGLAAAITAALVGLVVSGATGPVLVSDRLPYFLFGGLSALVLLDRERCRKRAPELTR